MVACLLYSEAEQKRGAKSERSRCSGGQRPPRLAQRGGSLRRASLRRAWRPEEAGDDEV